MPSGGGQIINVELRGRCSDVLWIAAAAVPHWLYPVPLCRHSALGGQ